MSIRTPRPLEAAILLALAAACERDHINFLSADELLAALRAAGHHPTPNVFRRALAAMEEDDLFVKRHRLPGRKSNHAPRVYSTRELEELVEAGDMQPAESAQSTDVFAVDSYYLTKIAGEYLEEGEPRPSLSARAREAVETFYRTVWAREAFA